MFKSICSSVIGVGVVLVIVPLIWVFGDVLAFPEVERVVPYELYEHNPVVHKVEYSKDMIPVYFSIKNILNETISPRVVVNGQDWTTKEGILAMIGDHGSDEANAIAAWQFVMDHSRHFLVPAYGDGEPENGGPIAFFNNWGYGWCSNRAYALQNLARWMGMKARTVYLNEHVVAEVFYDDAWHMLDADRYTYYKRNGHILSVDEIMADLSVLDNPIYGRMQDHWGDTWVSVSQRTAFSEPAKFSFVDYSDSLTELGLSLRPGEEIRYYYKLDDAYFWNYNDAKPEPGSYVLDRSSDRMSDMFTNGFLFTPVKKTENDDKEIMIDLPYPIVGAWLKGVYCLGENSVLVSLDRKEWVGVADHCDGSVLNLSSIFPIGDQKIQPARTYWVRAFLTQFNAELVTEFQVAPESLPKLQKGSNRIELFDASQAEVVFGY